MEAIDQAAELLAAKDLFEGYPRPYWVAGGWALDLFARRVRRPHGDVDVLVLARDLEVVAETFTRPRPVLQFAETGEQRPWADGENLTPGSSSTSSRDTEPPMAACPQSSVQLTPVRRYADCPGGSATSRPGSSCAAGQMWLSHWPGW